MKYFLSFFLLAALTLQAQKKSIPAKFVWVQKRSLIVSVYETSCEDWLTFMTESIQDPKLLPEPNELVKKCIYVTWEGDVRLVDSRSTYRDTSFVDRSKGKGKKTRKVEKCASMPVTGITHEQALAYCEWLSEIYADDSRYNSLHLNFRLATPSEMDSLLSDVFSPWPRDDEHYLALQQGINKRGCALYNHRHTGWCDASVLMKNEYGYAIPMKTGAFFPDKNGLWDLMGNVAEMTSEKGIARGGSCIHLATECQPEVANRYESPQVWLGFRVVADLKN